MSRDVLIADLQELETMDASEIYSKRLNAKELIFHKQGEFFPIADGRIKIPWRRSGTENIHLDTAATNSRRGSRWLSWRIRRVSSTTSWLISRFRWSDERFLVHVGKLHIPPSRWTQSQTLLAERRIVPNSTKIYWCNQNYTYEFGCQAREAQWWSLEHWWLSRLIWSLDKFHTIYSTRRKSSWRIHLFPGEINEETVHIQAKSTVARALEINGEACQAERKAKVVWREGPFWKCKKIAWNPFPWDLFHRPRGYGIQGDHQGRT